MTAQTLVTSSQAAMSKNDVKDVLYIVQRPLTTNGKTKTEIKGKHKRECIKASDIFLRMNAIPVIYDCEWKFTATGRCQAVNRRVFMAIQTGRVIRLLRAAV